MPYGLSTRFPRHRLHLARLPHRPQPDKTRRMRLKLITAILAPLLLVVSGCGGDNLSLCDGCPTPTAQPSATPTSTNVTPTPTPAPTVSGFPTPLIIGT